MSRPGVSVVMPFAGSRTDAQQALEALRALGSGPQDELILADNSGVAPSQDGVVVVSAVSERSPSHARNIGGERASRDWILFLDADCRPVPGLIESYFTQPIPDDVGALAGEVIASAHGSTLASRYAAARNFLGLDAHLAHPYLPRAVAANLLVRRTAFEQVGGFYEGVRAAEDTDFTWRLQRAGWALQSRPGARVEHRYRTSMQALRRQWRGYAAGRAWLGRRYEDFEPEPALRRAVGRVLRRRRRGAVARAPAVVHRRDRGAFLALDAILGVEELAGLTFSNRPRSRRPDRGGVQVVLVTDRFPTRGDPFTDFALTLANARVEAVARPEQFDARAARELPIDYREDDGGGERAVALARLLVGHPLRCALDAIRRGPGDPKLLSLAPAVRRLARDPGARVHALGGEDAWDTARRLAALAGCALEGT